MADDTRAGRLLRTEAAALLPLLRRMDPALADSATCLPGWSVRDVMAHCAAALNDAAAGTMHGFSPAENQADVDARRPLPFADVLAELERGYEAAAVRMDSGAGALDGLALGEWVHGGDVREVLGRSDAYASAGIELALSLLVDRMRARGVPSVDVTLVDGEQVAGSGWGRFAAGAEAAGGPAATLRCATATLVRLAAGRPADPADFELHGATPPDLVVFS